MFQGYSQETVDFMWGIRFNNERGWFLAHKDDYQQHLLAPTRELGQAVYEGLSAALPQEPLILKVSRIYRDARMHYPVPYKESLWLCIRQDVEWWAENPCLYFEIRPEGASAGFISVRSPAPFPNWSRILPGRATLNVRPPGSRGRRCSTRNWAMNWQGCLKTCCPCTIISGR